MVLLDSYDPPESIGTKKFKTYLVWRHSDVISYIISISYQTLFQYHTSKQTSIKNTTWYWGHDLKAKKAWDNHALNRGYIKYTDTFKNKNTLQTDANTQDMPQKEINCIQTVKLISAHFGSVWWFCNVLEFCPKNSKKEVHVISDVMSKTRKSPKIAKIMVFHYFFKQKLHFLAMMCVKVCLHMFLLQINQKDKIKYSGSVSWKTKKTKNTIVCNFNGKSVFRCTQRAITQRCVITLGPIFIKMVLNLSARMEGKKSKVSARKKKTTTTTGRDITKNVEGGGGGFRPPALLGLSIWLCMNLSGVYHELMTQSSNLETILFWSNCLIFLHHHCMLSLYINRRILSNQLR